MRALRRWLLILLLLLVFISSIGFSLWNTMPVPLSFGFHDFDSRPLAFWLIAAFCAGGVLGLILGAGLIHDIKLKRRIRALEKELVRRPIFTRRDIDSPDDKE
jgi:uncharacterized integral membrane protein